MNLKHFANNGESMAMKSVTFVRTYSLLLVCLAALLLAVACGSTSPTSPDPTPTPTPTPSPTPTPAPTPTPTPSPGGGVSITVEPNPVPWTSAAVDGCDASTPNRWIWRQIIVNNGSTTVVFSQRFNFFDDRQVSAPLETVTLAPGERHERTTRWCSGLPGDHTFRTDWDLSTGVKMTGPTVRLLKQ
jgi:hypothetical protein